MLSACARPPRSSRSRPVQSASRSRAVPRSPRRPVPLGATATTERSAATADALPRPTVDSVMRARRTWMHPASAASRPARSPRPASPASAVRGKALAGLRAAAGARSAPSSDAWIQAQRASTAISAHRPSTATMPRARLHPPTSSARAHPRRRADAASRVHRSATVREHRVSPASSAVRSRPAAFDSTPWFATPGPIRSSPRDRSTRPT
jgi:hypothetical protein